MGDRRMTRSEQALILMSRNDIISTESLNALWGRDYGAETLRELQERGYATTIKIQFTAGAKSRKYSRTCFAITQKGIDFLRARGYDTSLLFDDYAPESSYAPRKKASPPKTAARLLKETTANIFFTQHGAITLPVVAAIRTSTQPKPIALASPFTDDGWYDSGAYIEDDFFDDEDIINSPDNTTPSPDRTTPAQRTSCRPTIPNLIRSQQQKENTAWGTQEIPENSIFFSARSTMRKSSRYAQEYRELSMSECSGVAATNKKAMLVYTASTDGMPWTPYSSVADTTITKAFMFNHHIPKHHMGDKASGILLVSSPSVLSTLFFNRCKRKMRTRFGAGLNALYVIPISQDGMAQVNYIMQDDLVQSKRNFVATACTSNKFTANGEPRSKSEYPLIETASGALCAYGIDMDYNQLARWYATATSEAENPKALPRKIICHDFQIPYYKAILGDSFQYITTE